MASKPAGFCCTQGFKHSGEATGSFVEINGIECYVTGDESKASEYTHIMFTDVIGHRFINAQLLCDEYAKTTGAYVIAPDLFKGDPVPLNKPEGYDLIRDWFPQHVPEITQPIVDKITSGVKEKYSPKYTVATGFCFGAKYAVRCLGAGLVQAAAVFHPSFVEIDEVKAIKGPLFIAAAETDTIFTVELRHETEKVLAEVGAKYRITLMHGVEHGFAVRGDISVPWIKYAKEKAFADAVDWFDVSKKIEYN